MNTVTQPNGGPPSNVDPTDLFARLSKMERPSRIVDFPRTDPATGKALGQVAIVILTQAELMSCHTAAEEYAQAMLKNPAHRASGSLGYEDLYRDGKVCEMLQRACRRVHEGKPIPVPWFPTVQGLRQFLIAPEIAVLISAYIDWQQESGPIVGSMTQDEMDSWIELLKEGASRLPLARLSSEARTDLLMHSVSRLRSYSTDSTSYGSQQSNFSPTEVPPPAEAEPPPEPQTD